MWDYGSATIGSSVDLFVLRQKLFPPLSDNSLTSYVSFEKFNIEVVQQEKGGGYYCDRNENVNKHVAPGENELIAKWAPAS
jgi:hypothetical protein